MMTPPTPKTAKTSRNAAIVAAWQAGTPDIAIGRRFGITGGRVRDIINAAPVKAVRAGVVLVREAK